MKTRYITKCKMFCFVVILAVIITIFHFRTVTAALFDTKKAAHIVPDTIENSTLIIGTHLIYLHSLNEQIYSIAMESASSSGQDKIYYKSEMAGGMWINITDAGSVNDITTAGNMVDVSEIASLYLTHHTMSDGITYDLSTNSKICIFNTYDVYDLESMPELESLKMQYDVMKESESESDTIARNTELVRKMFALDISTDATKKSEEQLNALQYYYEQLVANHADSKDSAMVLKIMEKVDNTRKVSIFAMVNNALSTLQDSVADVSDDENLEIDDALLNAIGDSQYSVSESMSEAKGNMLVKGNTIVSEMEYKLSEEMISNAQSNNFFGCDEQNKKLQYLDNISNGRIVDRAEELKLLEDMIESADIKYGVNLAQGVTDQYNTLLSQNVSHAALQKKIKEDMVEANATKGELEFFIQAKADRLEKEYAQKFILQRIQDSAKFNVVIKNDDYSAEYKNSVDSYVEWLNNLLKNMKSTGNSQSEEDSLYEQKADLQEQKLQALDVLDLDTAKRIDVKIEAVDEKIGEGETTQAKALGKLLEKKAELEKKTQEDSQSAEIQAELSRIEVEIADISSGLQNDSQAANIMQSKNEVLDILANEDINDVNVNRVSDNIELLVSMLDSGSALSKEALKEIYIKLIAKSELENIKDYEKLQEKIENSLAECVVNTTLSGELSVQGAQNILSEIFDIENILDDNGNISSDISEEDGAAILIALGDFNELTARNVSVDNSNEGNGESSSNISGNTVQNESTDSSDATGSTDLENESTDSSDATGSADLENESTDSSDATGSADLENESTDSSDATGNADLENEGTDSSDATGSTDLENESTDSSDATGSADLENESTDSSDATGNADLENEGTDSSDATGNADLENEGTDSSDVTGDVVIENEQYKTTDDVTPSPVEQLTSAIAAKTSESDKGYVFLTKRQGNELYVPAKTLADYLGYRYIWNDTHKNAILSKGRYYYSFVAFKENVENEKGEYIYMNSPAGFSGDVYVPSSFVKDYFECYIYDISGTNYSVLVNDKVVEKSQEILSELLEKGGY